MKGNAKWKTASNQNFIKKLPKGKILTLLLNKTSQSEKWTEKHKAEHNT